jgi:hypothetical protein
VTFKFEPHQSGVDTSLTADRNVPILKMAEREDWALFRSIDGLQQKAGVPADRLQRLILKEIADNGLDSGNKVKAERIDNGVCTYFVEDNGPGLDGTPEEIASLFSIRRPMRSSKLLRLPQRGALGNGLRVVAGAVLTSEGKLTVITRNKRLVLRPEADGSTAVVKVTSAKRPIGTRIEIAFGKALPDDPNPLAWAKAAIGMAKGETYSGRSSPYWYDAVQFHELILAHGSQPLRGLIANLDGCTGGKAGEILAAAKLDRANCTNVNRKQAALLLAAARKHTHPVNPERLGCVGREAFPLDSYASERGTVRLGSVEPRASIPIVVEVWATKHSHDEDADQSITIFVNRTPVTGEVEVYRDHDKDICLHGCGLGHVLDGAPKKGAYFITVNILTPYCPIVSDGKQPDLAPFIAWIDAAVVKALKRAQRAAPTERQVSQKDVVLENLEQAIADVSGDGEFRFNERQIFYVLRPIVLEKSGQPLTIGNFKGIITDYENEHGEIEGMYREPRGSIYHPHLQETIPLGTLTVEAYERPVWNYNKVVYIEKEGFSEALKDNGWSERHDCMLISSKGNTTRAARDLVDKLAEHDEPVTVFCVHDADAYGTMIYQTFQEATKARGARKVHIVNLGLEPWEALEIGLEVEKVEIEKRRKPVADYVREREDGDHWDEWLQTHRIELNAMTTPQFIAWLDRKMAAYGKLIPPAEVITAELDSRLAAKVRAALTERILREADFERQVAEVLAAITRPSSAALIESIESDFEETPEREWRALIEATAEQLIRQS